MEKGRRLRADGRMADELDLSKLHKSNNDSKPLMQSFPDVPSKNGQNQRGFRFALRATGLRHAEGRLGRAEPGGSDPATLPAGPTLLRVDACTRARCRARVVLVSPSSLSNCLAVCCHARTFNQCTQRVSGMLRALTHNVPVPFTPTDVIHHVGLCFGRA